MHANARDPQAGFTLVEVLVAFVVASVTLGMIFAAIQLAGTRERMVIDQAGAVSIAQTQIERFVAASYVEGERNGSEDGLRWRSEERAAMRDPRGLIVLAELDLVVSDAAGRRLIAIERRVLKPLAVQ